ncbi:hypothetical protein Tco_1394629 [Tanacetum coccineum]
MMRISYRKACKKGRERILKDYWRERFGGEEDDLEEYLEDPEECEEDKANTMLGVIHDKLNNDWFNNTSEDEDDLEGILDYLKPRSYDGFIDLDDEAYNKRRKRISHQKTENNAAVMRAGLMKKWPKKEITKQRRFLYKEIGIRSPLDLYSCGSKVLSWRNHLGEWEQKLYAFVEDQSVMIYKDPPVSPLSMLFISSGGINMMNEVDIENLTIKQYLMLTQEKQTQEMIRTESGRMITKNIDDMTIAEYMEYEAEIKRDP